MNNKIELTKWINERLGNGAKVKFKGEKKPRTVVGIWNDAIAFACLKATTIEENIVLLYEDSEIKELIDEGSLEIITEVKAIKGTRNENLR